jgi:Arc/MetJ-type ribon-helix-helix transcriptional regulator
MSPDMHTQTPTRQTLSLPPEIWQQIDRIRRQAPGAVPSTSEVVRTLIREALEARAQAPRKAPR